MSHTFDEIKAIDQKYYFRVFGDRLPVLFTRGEGTRLYDADGKEYIDFLAGIAVNALGYSDRGFAEAAESALAGIIHTCNYFYNEPQALLAEALCERTEYNRIFFGNSGAEANECALKLAKKRAADKGNQSADFLCLKNSFHGRTLFTLAATGQERFHTPYRPMPYRFAAMDPANEDAFLDAIHGGLCGVIIELIQGEGGVNVLGKEFAQKIRIRCDKSDVPLIIDEVQTGMGRTGTFLAQEQYGITGDITTLAKALGGGIPIGACLAKEAIGSYFLPGDHGSTFGGGPLACTAALYMNSAIDQEMLHTIQDIGAYFKKQLLNLQKAHSGEIKEIRGMGLLLGAELCEKYNAQDMQLDLLESGFVIGTAARNTLRFLPPYIISKEDIDRLIGAIDQII